jgi:hypothetical protein
MAKKRTGLQSEIAGIFSGVPVPKKGGPRSKSGEPAQKSDDQSSKTDGPAMPRPATPQPITPAPVEPTLQQKVKFIPATSQLKVAEIKVSEPKIRQAPRKVSRRRKNNLFAPKAGVGSSRQKTGIILFIVFSTALVIVLARPYLTSHSNPAVSQTTRNTNAGNPASSNIEIDWPMPPVYSANLRDPMELGSRRQTTVNTTYGLEVVGIVVSEDRKFATVGTQTVQEGDLIEGTSIRVKKINPNSVEFEEDGKTWIQKTRERQEIGVERK